MLPENSRKNSISTGGAQAERSNVAKGLKVANKFAIVLTAINKI